MDVTTRDGDLMLEIQYVDEREFGLTVEGYGQPDGGWTAGAATTAAGGVTLLALGLLRRIRPTDAPWASTTQSELEAESVADIDRMAAASGFADWARRMTLHHATPWSSAVLTATDLLERIDAHRDGDAPEPRRRCVTLEVDGEGDVTLSATAVYALYPIDPLAVLRGEPLAPDVETDD